MIIFQIFNAVSDWEGMRTIFELKLWAGIPSPAAQRKPANEPRHLNIWPGQPLACSKLKGGQVPVIRDLDCKRKPRTQSSLPGRNPIDRQTCKLAIDKWKPTKNASTWPKTLTLLTFRCSTWKKWVINCAILS